MIISANQARKIVSNHAVLKAVPELLGAVEKTATARRTWEVKKGCHQCKESEVFAEAEVAALEAISNLSKDAIARLKIFLNEKELYIYEPVPGGRPRSKQLGV